MRKLIDVDNSKNFLKCDNPSCDYVYEDDSLKTVEGLRNHVDSCCPKCGENLLTEQDFKLYQHTLKYINFINKWFGWLSIFYSKKSYKKYEMNGHNNNVTFKEMKDE